MCQHFQQGFLQQVIIKLVSKKNHSSIKKCYAKICDLKWSIRSFLKFCRFDLGVHSHILHEFVLCSELMGQTSLKDDKSGSRSLLSGTMFIYVPGHDVKMCRRKIPVQVLCRTGFVFSIQRNISEHFTQKGPRSSLD